MRFVATLLVWLLTTAALMIAVPAVWAQLHLIDADGYSSLARSAAKDPELRSAMAAELTAQLTKLGSDAHLDLDEGALSLGVRLYTASPLFPIQFAQANQVAHHVLFTDAAVGQSGDSGRWTTDLAPMLSNGVVQHVLDEFGIRVPPTLTIPLTDTLSPALRPGQLRQVSQWGPWVSAGSAVAAGILALLTLVCARSRGKAVGALGVSALLVGVAGFVGIEVGRPYVNQALNDTSGNIRRIADVMVDHAIGDMHLWLTVTLGVGGVLLVVGLVVTTLGGLQRRD